MSAKVVQPKPAGHVPHGESEPPLALFLRGVNVGGHRRFRPSALAASLAQYGAVNIGAAGTLVIRRPTPRARFDADLRAAMPFETAIHAVVGADILALEAAHPFGHEPAPPDIVRFVSILPDAAASRPDLPHSLPDGEDWLVRLVEARGRFVLGLYRRDMKTIDYLGRMNRLFGGRLTTRNWNTIVKVAAVLAGK